MIKSSHIKLHREHYFFCAVNENHSEEAECYGSFNQINFILKIWFNSVLL